MQHRISQRTCIYGTVVLLLLYTLASTGNSGGGGGEFLYFRLLDHVSPGILVFVFLVVFLVAIVCAAGWAIWTFWNGIICKQFSGLTPLTFYDSYFAVTALLIIVKVF